MYFKITKKKDIDINRYFKCVFVMYPMYLVKMWQDVKVDTDQGLTVEH